MKLVTAIIQPPMLDQVQTALVHLGVRGMTVSEVTGYARQQGHKEVYRGETMTVDFVLKVRLEILTPDADADAIVGTIVMAARTGEVGDGKVWVTTLDSVTRVRTGETGDAAV